MRGCRCQSHIRKVIRMNDEITLTLNSPITDEQWDAITDVDFDHTDRIWFHTKHGKDVEFVKQLPSAQPVAKDINVPVKDCISRQAAIDLAEEVETKRLKGEIDLTYAPMAKGLMQLPPAQPEREDYAEMKREFLRMASYIDSLLVCPDEQKETLMNFISRIAADMPWTERD